MTTHEKYKLACHACGHTVEFPAGDPNRPQRSTCPHCRAPLLIVWRPRDLEGDS